MKLVVCYSHGDYESYYDENICIEYESKEKFLKDFVEALGEYKKVNEGANEIRERISEVVRNDYKKGAGNWANDPEYKELMDEFSAYIKEQDKKIYGIYVGPYKFASFDDFDKYTYEIHQMPDVYTLEEWFEQNHIIES